MIDDGELANLAHDHDIDGIAEASAGLDGRKRFGHHIPNGLIQLLLSPML
jgi:hypothetical protein